VSRLVVVSNRLADPRKAAAGGLAVALGESLQRTGGLWFGWSGDIAEPGEALADEPEVTRWGKVSLAGLGLSREDHDGYYLGYANKVLWPVFHYRLDLADFESGFLDRYKAVNRRFARALKPLLKDDDVLWIHDYHLIPLGAELRALGCRQRMGFFLHIPLPPPQLLSAMPGADWLLQMFFAYDLVGFQAQADVQHFARFGQAEGDVVPLPGDRYSGFGRVLKAQAFPIGMDVDEFRRLGEQREAVETFEQMRDQYSHRRVLIGADRLDYSKGLPQRFRAFKRLLDEYEDTRSSATLIQIAAPSREEVDAYADIRRELEGLTGAINGQYGTLDWVPIRYIHSALARKRMPGLCRAAKVALVTPLRDGMNLVAKEFVAAQDPADPGVLVLSRFAGAAEQMKQAILVNPHDTQGTAAAIHRALQMPLEERQQRHAALLAGITEFDIHWWRRTYLEALQEAAP
jgi:trehalose 6-phosphate synthase